MPRILPLVLMFASLGLFAPTMRAESHNPADYPLRIHIYRRNETTFYHNRQAEEAKGEGRANLFEGSEPKGVDFQFECDTKLQTSSGYELFAPFNITRLVSIVKNRYLNHRYGWQTNPSQCGSYIQHSLETLRSRILF